MRLEFDAPADGQKVSILASFNSPTTAKSMVFLVNFISPSGKSLELPELTWSKKFSSHFIYCPEMSAPGQRSLATLPIESPLDRIVIRVEPWQSRPSVVDAVEGIHLHVGLKNTDLALTCAGVPA